MSGTEHYQDLLDREILPWIHDRVTAGNLTAKDGARLRYYYAIRPDAKAAITVVHGFCEFFGKYHEVLWRLYEEGYSVFFMEQRGHGKSQRFVEPKDLVYVHSFNDYVSDLHLFTKKIVFPMTRHLKHVLLGHSMGGAVSALYLEKYPKDYDVGILSSPMLAIDFGKTPAPAVKAAAVVSKVAKQDLNPLPGHTLFDGIPDFEHSNALDKERYDYQFALRCSDRDYQTWAGTNGWLRAAIRALRSIHRNTRKIIVPVYVLKAGLDTTVDNKGADAFVDKVDTGSMHVIRNARHELYNADEKNRELWYSLIFRYLKKHL